MKKYLFLMSVMLITCSMASCTKASMDETIINPTESRVSESTNYSITVEVVSDGVSETTITVMDANKTGIFSTLVTDSDWQAGLAIDLKTKQSPAYLYSPDAENDGFVPLPNEAIETKAGPIAVTMKLVRNK